MREDLRRHFAERLRDAMTRPVPGTTFVESMIDDKTAHRLVDVIAEMIEAAIEETRTR